MANLAMDTRAISLRTTHQLIKTEMVRLEVVARIKPIALLIVTEAVRLVVSVMKYSVIAPTKVAIMVTDTVNPAAVALV